MTDISVHTTAYQAEDRSWYLGTPQDPGFAPSGTLDVSAFTAGTHFPDGFIKSGEPLGRITATGLYGPYDPAAVDGRATGEGFLFSSVKVPNPGDLTVDVGCAVLKAFAAVKEARLPRAVDAAFRTAVRNIHFVGDDA